MTAIDLCREAFAQFTLIVFVLGACIGSFLNVVIWRLPRGERLSAPPSHCPNCHHAIRPWENIPILSWLALRARCSACKEPISARYPAVELLTGVAFLCVWFHVLAREAPPVSALPLFFLVSALIAVTFTDIETRTIPNKITYSGLFFGLAMVLMFPAAHPAGGPQAPAGFIFPPGLLPERFLPFADSAAGALAALLILWAIRVVSGVMFGRRRWRFENHETLRFTPDGLFADTEKLFGWEEIVAGDITISPPVSSSPPLFSSALTDEREIVLHYRHGLLKGVNGRISVDQLSHVEAGGVSATVTRDAFGWGDIKLIIMIAALSGAAALPFILILSAVPGMIVGTALSLACSTCRKQGIPFAPFLSFGCGVWIFFGDRLVAYFVG
ncbi:MAG: prepilin peptidase [Lentisphaeria bacterium]|nr:prepilin peptidase [Lentisphaeria bacterium]